MQSVDCNKPHAFALGIYSPSGTYSIGFAQFEIAGFFVLVDKILRVRV